MKLTRHQLILNAIFCTALLIVILWALYSEYNRPWKKYQKEKKIQQLYLQDIGGTDRCITCHQGADKPGFINRPQPFKTHSGDYLKHHPVEKFGCVVCHQGQGAALTVDAAHGNVKNWTKPILKGPFAQSSCGKCHSMDQALPLNVELKGASAFVEGWKLFNENNCLGCHKLTGYKVPDRIAPALTSIGNKVNREWLIKWLKNPKDYLPKTKMPRFDLSDEEIGYVADFLMGKKNNPSLFLPLDKGRLGGVTGNANGILISLGCLGCHTIDGNGNSFAPDLSNIGSKVNADWLVQYLKNPKAYQAKTPMPNLMIADGEIQSIVGYLMSLEGDNHKIINPPASPFFKGGDHSPLSRGVRGVSSSLAKRGEEKFSENIDKGRKLVKDKGCTGCHEIEKFPTGYDAPTLDGIGSKRVDELVFGDITGVDKTLTNWLMIKVQDPERFATDRIVTRMPNYNFSKEQAEALVTFLLGIRNESIPSTYKKTLLDPDKPEMRGESVFEKYNCAGCHKFNDKGGNIAPDISKEAKKSRPEWLFAFLKSPYKIRPEFMLKAKMPDFNLSDKEVNSIVGYLAAVSGESFPYNFEPKKEVSAGDIDDGEKLYQEIFACTGCHSANGRGGQIGPDHTDVSSRLKREWIEQWLKDPQAVQPDVRMPKFKFRDWEFEALTNYLMTLGKYRFVRTKNAD
ncbi:MAG: c-type cytochrome [Nitrospirae bacterium]|nr:c-type cytochrome [Nitrospirota bacterium]